MTDFKKLIQVADVYGKTDQQVQEGIVSDAFNAVLTKLGIRDKEAEAIADDIESKAPEVTSDKVVDALKSAPKATTGQQASTASKEKTILDPQPRGYGMEQGKVIVQSGDRYLVVDVSKKVPNPFKSGQEVYTANSLSGYEYNQDAPQAPTRSNADRIYIPVDDLEVPPVGRTDSPSPEFTSPEDNGIQGMAPTSPEQPVADPDENEPKDTTASPTVPEPKTDPEIPGRDGDDLGTAPTAPKEPRDGDDLGTAPTKPKEPEKAPEPESPLLQFMRKNKGGLANDPDEVAAIKELQGILGIAQDGKYGPATRAAVRKYQQDNGLRADGDAGSQTISKMKQQADPGGFDTPGNDLTKPNESVNEASMNISMNGASSAEVAELMGILKNAGMQDVEKIMAMPAPEPAGCATCGGSHDMGSPCGMGEDAVEEEYENEPDETYADTQYITHDLAGGINKPKKSYKATPRGDNPMAVKEQYADMLAKALNKKLK